MKEGVKEIKIVSSFFWVLIEKIGYSLISLISTLILSRLLTPYDFGVIGSVMIITSLSNMIVESGLGAALVNKLSASKEDYNTVFTFNFLMSCFLFLLVFFLAPYIANYFEIPILKKIVRVLSLTFVFNSFSIVQRTILIKELQFKKQSLIALFSLISSSSLSVYLAFIGWGVWAIVIQLVCYSILYSLTIFFIIRYIPKFYFSITLFNELLRFGGRITLSSALQVGYNDIISSVIGKVYSFQITGLYSQSQKLISFPVNIFRSLFDGAAFPILSKIIDKKEFSLKCSQINRSIYLLAFPFLFSIPFNTSQIIKIVLGEKWMDANFIFSILSFGVVVLLIEIATLNILKSSGHAKPYLNIGIYKTLVGFVVLIITFFFSIEFLLFGIILNSIISTFLAVYYVSLLTDYKLRYQYKDILIPLLIALISNLTAFFLVKIFSVENVTVQLVLHVIIVLFIMFFICIVFKINELTYFIHKIRKRNE
jgi:O-antigen/teichoic acid export membrane protein